LRRRPPRNRRRWRATADKWIAKINSEVGVRVDEAGYNARVKADEIARMCKEGKMDEAQKTATETMANLGIKQ
jgi:hypothetical protein